MIEKKTSKNWGSSEFQQIMNTVSHHVEKIFDKLNNETLNKRPHLFEH